MSNNFNTDALKSFMNKLNSLPPLSREEEIELALLAQDQSTPEGIEARTILIESNTRLVVSIARNYNNNPFFSLLDLIQEGCIGLTEAVDKFDVTREYHFSTYATHLIRNAIRRALAEKKRTIHVSSSVDSDIKRMHLIQNHLLQELGRYPTDEEVSVEMEIDVVKLQTYKNVDGNVASLSTPIGEEEDTNLGDFIEDSSIDIEGDYVKSHIDEQLQEVLSVLTQREYDIITNRYGVLGCEPKTQEQVGSMFDLSKGRIGQIEQMSLKKLQQSSSKFNLKDLLS